MKIAPAPLPFELVATRCVFGDATESPGRRQRCKKLRPFLCHSFTSLNLRTVTKVSTHTCLLMRQDLVNRSHDLLDPC
jgi:hypothetical protein